MTARWNHCRRPFGHSARAIAIQTMKHAADKAKRRVRKPNGGACGIARRATTKPVDQIRTKSHGIALANITPPCSFRSLAGAAAAPRTGPPRGSRFVACSTDTGADFRQGLLEVVDHRPDRQHRRSDDEDG